MSNHRKVVLTEIIMCLCFFCIAGLVRLPQLGTYPPGFHGDEAYTAIDAKRILDNGIIEPYTGNALGQPTGPLYSTALFITVFGYTIESVRASMAVFGMASVVALYVLMRLLFPRSIATWGTMAFCFSLYHVHFSRIAFMLNAAPLFQILALIFLVLARRNAHKWYLYALSGYFAGIGIHSYNTFVVFPPILLGSIIIDVVIAKQRTRRWVGVFAFVIAFVMGGLPLLHFITFHLNDYLQHHRTYAVLNHTEYLSAPNELSRIAFFIQNGIKNIRNFYRGYAMDAVDGFGITYTFHPIHLVLMAVGAFFALLPRKLSLVIGIAPSGEARYFARWAVIGVILINMTAFLTFDAFHRRQILALALMYLLLAYALFNMYHMARNAKIKGLMVGIFLLVIGYGAVTDIRTYVYTTIRSGQSHWIFASEIVTAGRLIAKHATNSSTIALYATRWDCNFPSFQFLIDHKPCISMNTPDAVPLTTLPMQNVSFVLIGDYMDIFSDIQTQFPMGKRYLIQSDSQYETPSGIVYVVP